MQEEPSQPLYPALHVFRSILRRIIIGGYRRQLFGERCSRLVTRERVVALTFDDGPLLPYTELLLETLKQNEVKATFFCVGRNLARHLVVGKRILAEGHEIGNHSFSHARLYLKSPSFVRTEIEKTDRVIRQLGVGGEILFRAPFGCSFIILPWILMRNNRKHILFDFYPDPSDWSGAPSEAVSNSIAAQARPGSIIVLHDGNPIAGKNVAETTRMVIKKLKESGYRFVTVSQLLTMTKS